MMKQLKRFKYFGVVVLVVTALTLFNKALGFKAVSLTGSNLKEMLLTLPPVFILLGLLDIWVPREAMVKYMGDKSGMKGIVLSILLGSAAAGPLYGAFPIAAVFMKKGVRFSNIVIFLGAWSTTKIPMLLFESSSLGLRFAVTRLLIDIPGIIIIAYLISALMSKEEIETIYANAESL
ncbi:MAG: permease [Clostridia bacterium]|jgi:uncharacterized membrane protein YraQ (UPF0718 family)|nr:permease [Clostridia bacterium]